MNNNSQKSGRGFQKAITNFLSIFVFIVYLAMPSFAQPTILFNNGAQIYTGNTAILHLNGSFQNDNAVGANVFENNGTMTIANSGTPGTVYLKTNSTLKGNGTYKVQQDWVNDATFNADNSTVMLNGDFQQYITSNNNTVTTFNNLVLIGTGPGVNAKKTLQFVDAVINPTGTLTINNRELETLTNTMFVLNPSPTCVTNDVTLGSEGFVSSSFVSGGSGYFSRITNSTSGYIYPTGSSVSGSRYRPVMITPASAAVNIYTARLGYSIATADGFDIAAIDTTMCMVNPIYYHEIKRSSGTDNADIEIFYNQTTDGGWDGMAKWNSPTAALWNEMGTVTATANVPLSSVLKVNWADFSNSPYILTRTKPEKPDLTCALVCANTAGNIFSATGNGSTFTWTAPAGATIVSGQNTGTATIDWGPSAGTVSVTTSSLLNCASNPASCIVNPSSSTVAAFSSASTSLSYNFTDLSTGGVNNWTWDFGDGTFSTLQNPSHNFSTCGPQKICLTAAKDNCVDSACTNIEINQLYSIPNIFSPDGDGSNDVFYIDNTCMKDFHLEIFSRWGSKVFESDGAGWDGYTASGALSPDGTYFYILKITTQKDIDESTKGYVSLVRKK